MKKFIINILIFCGIVAVVDVAAGRFFWYLQSIEAGGRSGDEYYVCKESKEDVLIMGSSRALHHYVSSLFLDSLGMSCFNGGQDGNGIVMQYGRWKMISKRHVPKLVIYDVEPIFDYGMNDNTRYIDRLKPFAGDKEVKQYITGLYPLEDLKLFSHLYRYNYKFLEIASDCLNKGNGEGGYKPLYGHIRREMVEADAPDKTNSEVQIYDELKVTQLHNLITEVKASGSTIVLVSSPYWKSYGIPDLRIIEKIAEELGVPFFNYSDSDLCNNPDYFADSMHLNDVGAHVFTEDVVGKIKTMNGL